MSNPRHPRGYRSPTPTDIDVLQLRDKLRARNLTYEDYREYDAEMLGVRLALSKVESEDLYYLIQEDFNPKPPQALKDCDPLMLKEGLIEALHGNLDGWESPHDKVTIMRFIQDMQRYADNSTKE